MLRTLIVDDYPNNRDTLKNLFTEHFPLMICEEASDGKEAMEKVGSFQPDLIIMDIRLPDESGLELAKTIKVMNPDVRVLILTGHYYPEYKEMAAQNGADGFLVKGGASQEILAMIESFFPDAEESTIAKKQ